MDNDDTGFLIIIALAVAISFVGGAAMVSNNFQKEAVKMGHATWVADANGASKFQWVEIKQIDKK